MSELKPLAPEALYQSCDTSRLGFETTAELEEMKEMLGQDRAQKAIHFGVGIRAEGFNLFVLGPSGLGKLTLVRRLLEQRAGQELRAHDWCYLNNFTSPHKPRALSLPPGQGRRLRDDLKQLVEELGGAIPAAFESDEYRTRRQEIQEEFETRQEAALAELQKEAEAHDISLLRTPAGFAFAPMRGGEVLSPDQFHELSEEEQKRVEAVVSTLQEHLQRILLKIPQWRKQVRDKVRELNREITFSAVGHLMEHLHETYVELPEVLEHLKELEQDVIENAENFRKMAESPGEEEEGKGLRSSLQHRYEVNLIVENADHGEAPVVYEDNPSFQNLVGRVEHVAQMGTLVTDFTLLKPGALHRANGGYLIIDARRVLTQPFSWEGLKRALFSRQIRIESVAQFFSLVSTVSLEPEPIPLDVKVVLVGDRLLYYLLSQYDPDFDKLFKVAADFEEHIDRTPEGIQSYARLIGTLAREHSLLPLDRGGVARAIEHSARMAGDSERLSTHVGNIVDLLREAHHYASEAGREVITRPDIQTAIDARIHRSDRLRERIYAEIQRGTINIRTEGVEVGLVNGLSVIDLGNFAFGQPSRISATARFGEGEVVDIEREVEMGGSIHSKGVLILSHYLAARYARDRPLSLSASLVFEQSYGMVEGDSASVAELCALLSALSGAGVKQSLAVTGSVNQHGHVQAIGGVNEKIEGYFDICNGRGLTGEQGVLIPRANVPHLMLREDVVAACREGRFHVYPVETVDQAAALLTGLPAGEADREGRYPEGSLNRRVDDRLDELYHLRLELMEHKHDSGGETS